MVALPGVYKALAFVMLRSLYAWSLHTSVLTRKKRVMKSARKQGGVGSIWSVLLYPGTLTS